MMLWGAQTQDPWEARREPWPEKPWQSCRHSQLRATAGHRVGVWGQRWEQNFPPVLGGGGGELMLHPRGLDLCT